MPYVAGIDGCRTGWVLATMSADGGPVEIAVVPSFVEIVARVRDREILALGVDIPIGLPDAGPRACDIAARQQIGPRQSSVFPAPIRPVLSAATYEDALRVSRERQGKGMSLQGYHIMPKIREVDDVLAGETSLQRHIIEVHPEVSFAAMLGAPMPFAKRHKDGRAARISAIRTHFVDMPDMIPKPNGVAFDDVLDAIAALWSAQRWDAGTAEILGDPNERDSQGLRMEIIV